MFAGIDIGKASLYVCLADPPRHRQPFHRHLQEVAHIEIELARHAPELLNLFDQLIEFQRHHSPPVEVGFRLALVFYVVKQAREE